MITLLSLAYSPFYFLVHSMNAFACLLCVFSVAMGFVNGSLGLKKNRQEQLHSGPLTEEQLISSGLNCKCFRRSSGADQCCCTFIFLLFSFSFFTGTCDVSQVSAQSCLPFSIAQVYASYFESFTCLAYLFNQSWLLTLDSCFHGLDSVTVDLI